MFQRNFKPPYSQVDALCMESPFDVLDGVISTTSGYTDGYVHQPKYKDVANGLTDTPKRFKSSSTPRRSAMKNTQVFWRNIDPAKNRQFCDRGTQYRSGIYVYNEAQRTAVQASIDLLRKTTGYTGRSTPRSKPQHVFIVRRYHQDFYTKIRITIGDIDWDVVGMRVSKPFGVFSLIRKSKIRSPQSIVIIDFQIGLRRTLIPYISIISHRGLNDASMRTSVGRAMERV